MVGNVRSFQLHKILGCNLQRSCDCIESVPANRTLAWADFYFKIAHIVSKSTQQILLKKCISLKVFFTETACCLRSFKFRLRLASDRDRSSWMMMMMGANLCTNLNILCQIFEAIKSSFITYYDSVPLIGAPLEPELSSLFATTLH